MSQITRNSVWKCDAAALASHPRLWLQTHGYCVRGICVLLNSMGEIGCSNHSNVLWCSCELTSRSSLCSNNCKLPPCIMNIMNKNIQMKPGHGEQRVLVSIPSSRTKLGPPRLELIPSEVHSYSCCFPGTGQAPEAHCTAQGSLGQPGGTPVEPRSLRSRIRGAVSPSLCPFGEGVRA